MTTLHASTELRQTASGLDAAVAVKSLRLTGAVGLGYWQAKDTSG
jgi:hypothetical protein